MVQDVRGVRSLARSLRILDVARLHPKGVNHLAISTTDMKAQLTFFDTQETEQLELDFPLLSDAKREAMIAFGVEDPANQTAWPAVFVIGPDGTIVMRRMLETYKERPLPAEILEAIPAAP